MKKLWAAPILFAASQATAGGWEASKLDTSFMYHEGGFTEFSYGSLDYNVKANATNNGATLGVTGHKTAKSQTRPALSLKMGFGDFDFGVSSFTSGSIQMQGGAGKIIDPAIDFTATPPAPPADQSLSTGCGEVENATFFHERPTVLLRPWIAKALAFAGVWGRAPHFPRPYDDWI